MAAVIPDLSVQITRLIHYLEEVKNLTGYDVGLQAEINDFMRTLSTNLAYLKTSLPHTVSKDAIGLLANEVAEANRFMGECLEQDKFKRIWSARKTRSTLESLRQKLVSCFQLALFITSLDVTIEGQNRPTDFQQRMINLYFTHASDPLAARGQLQTLLQPLASEIKRQDQTLEKLVEFVERGGAANTGIATDRSTETEKFFADVLATVEQLQSNYRDPSSSSPNHDDSPDSSDSALEELVYDPVTKEIMIDPVKGSDGYTYDRWTIVNNNLVVSPFTRESLSIVCDDVTLRSWLFTKFHSQKLEEKFLRLREEYRRTTLDLVREGHDGEALERLEHVLKWAPKDSECQQLQREISSRLEKWRSLAESASPVFLVSNRINPNNAVGAGSSFTPQPDDKEAVKANSSVGSNTVAAGESVISPKFDNTAHKLDHSSQRGPEARSEASLGSRLTSWPLEGWANSGSSFDPRFLTVKEERVSPRPSMTAAVQLDPLPPVDGEAGREPLSKRDIALWLAIKRIQKSSSFSRTEMESAGEPTFSSQSDAKFDSSFNPGSFTVKEARASPRPSMTAAVQPDSLPSVEVEAGREGSTGPILLLRPANSPKSSSSSRNEMVPAGELKFSSQSEVVLSVGKYSSTQQDVEAGTGAKLVSRLGHAPPGIVTKTSFAPQDLPPKKSWFSAIRKFLRGRRYPHLYYFYFLASLIVLAVSTVTFPVWYLFSYSGDEAMFRALLSASSPSPIGGAAWRQDRAFTLHELEVMTNNFMSKIGEGVYYGRLSNGTPVAVKVNSVTSHDDTTEFEYQASIVVRVHHRNLVSLLGYCQENKQRILVYEFISKGTLREHLYGRELKGKIGWKERLDIAINAAKGLEYLHSGLNPMIIHGNITSNNILLNDKLLAKVAGFGFSLLTPEGYSVSGTSGYLDPEYYTHNKLTSKSDVYSFGVVLLEIICGRPPITTTDNNINLVEWARGHLESIIDPFIKGTYNLESMWKVAEIAVTCLNPCGIYRPDINQVVRALVVAVELEEQKTEKLSSFEASPLSRPR
ncbi:hypothetical protein R1sor_000518 [Riccia sorocarpa]|uniref:Protein kinase domain-containing protein n=1 Tax=Riccia sorocarpa TaxID=122646 RepID=A0ABD3GXH7_9MARC